MITNVDHSLSAERNEMILLEICANRLEGGGAGNASITPLSRPRCCARARGSGAGEHKPLSEGRHTFEARALDGEGEADLTPALWRWEVGRK